MNSSPLTLNAEPTAWPWKPKPKPPVGEVEFSYNSQDQTVLSPASTVVSEVEAGPSIDRRLVINEGAPKPEQGKYVYPTTDPRFHAANAFAASARTIGVFENALGHPIPWSFGEQRRLEIKPDQGNRLNAYYNPAEGSLNFFHGADPVTGKDVYSADSGEVVAHETGHAILDAMRPRYLHAWTPDAAAFHESFGDVMAMLVSLHDDRVLDRVVQETGGDLRKPNLVAAMGEELGMAINHISGKDRTGGDFTRNAINDFKWSEPSELPYNPPPDQLGREAHNFSRLFTGAVYDVLAQMTADNQAAGQSPRQAIRAAGEELLKLYAGLMKTAPEGSFTFREMAGALLAADREANQGRQQNTLTEVFKHRGILNGAAPVALAAGTGVETVTTTLDGADFGKFQGAEVSMPLDAGRLGLTAGASEAALKRDVGKLIEAGRILYTEPGQVVKPDDLVDADGAPYAGVVRWDSGKMTLERVALVD